MFAVPKKANVKAAIKKVAAPKKAITKAAIKNSVDTKGKRAGNKAAAQRPAKKAREEDDDSEMDNTETTTTTDESTCCSLGPVCFEHKRSGSSTCGFTIILK